MAITYKDIDLSFKNNIYNDFPVLLSDGSIKNMLYNNLLVEWSEINFNNNQNKTLKDTLFEDDNILTRILLENAIKTAGRKDDRIKNIKDIKIKFVEEDNLYNISALIVLKDFDINKNEKKTLEISLILNRDI